MLHVMTATLGMMQIRVLLCFGLFILLVGMLLSQLWIMMAKGSKAWYEVYEHAIYEIEHSSDYASEVVVNNMPKDGVIHGDVIGKDKPNDSLWSLKAGEYSPSKINIVIGQFSFAIFLIIYVFQVVMMASIDAYLIKDEITTIMALLIPLLMTLCFSCHCMKDLVRSSYLAKGYT